MPSEKNTAPTRSLLRMAAKLRSDTRSVTTSLRPPPPEKMEEDTSTTRNRTTSRSSRKVFV